MMTWAREQFGGFTATYRRELGAYFSTPMAYVFLAVFLLAIGMFTWEASRFFDTGSADLAPFFVWHPWLYMIFLPALAMRLWADERTAGTDELLLSLPLGMPGLVIGKLFAAWTVAGVGLALTQFEGAQRGVLELRAMVFFLGFTAFWAVLNGLWATRQRLG